MNKDQNTTNRPEAWLSLEQYFGDKEIAKRAENEFMSSPHAGEDDKDGFARRDFLKLMGASIALASAGCVRRPVQHIIPYAKAPKEITPGIANFYTSTWYDGVEGYGALVRTLEGRPVKMEGNPLHPMNLGSLPLRAHAEVLFLYDPDRLKGPAKNLQNKNRTNRETIGANWADVDKEVVERLKGGKVAVLTSTLPSPSARAVMSDFTKAFGARWIEYDSMPMDAVREANRLSYGAAVVPRYRLDKAKMVVSIDADILGTYIAPAEFTKQWSKAKKPGPDMIRLVSFESVVSLTGLNADDRIRIRPSQHLDVIYGLINSVAKASGGSANIPGGTAFLKAYDDVATRLGVEPELLATIGKQLWANRGKSLVMAGGLPTLTAQALELQVAVNLLNSVLGNDGQTVDAGTAYLTRQGSSSELSGLIADMNAGNVKTLVIHNLNPGYVLPNDSGFMEALKKVEFVVYTGNHNDETAKFADFVLPAGTTLESWGDYELQRGLVSIQQPTISPLHDSRSFEESILVWTKQAKIVPSRSSSAADWYEYVRQTWRSEVYPKVQEGRGANFEEFWINVLQNGVVDLLGRDRSGSARSFMASAFKPSQAKASTGYELVLFPTQQLADGRFANVSWLQEIPDPVTKIVWDNYLMVSLATARKEGLNEGDKVELKVGEKKLKVPVHIQPGMHDGVLALAVGFGRSSGGKIAREVGVNGYDLAALTNGSLLCSGAAASMKKTGEKYRLVSTQDHHVMEGRQLAVETTLDAYTKNPSSGIHRHKVFSIWPEHAYTKHRWAMSIDLNTCTGCSACVIACQSENNIPVVGKRYVMEGREMHWIRIDRYYKGAAEAPEAIFQPMLCQHCETAPCETVCPVLATVHSDEGLNDMVYNRCVGTRYCSNNCPYKVRRFNWFNYSKREAPLHMALNPDVTVRSRGVMEKCTFCVHRIRATVATKPEYKKAGGVPDGTIKTACQQTCPSDAIIFGDLNDPNSLVAKHFQEQRTYGVLEEWNTQPRVRYMSRVRNAERAVADAHGAGDKHETPAGKDNKSQGHGSVTTKDEVGARV